MTSAAPVVLACSSSGGSECFLDSEDLFDSSYVPNNPSLVLDTALWRSVSVDEPQLVVSEEVRNPEVNQEQNGNAQNAKSVAEEEREPGEHADLISLQTVPVHDYDDEILLNSSSELGLSTPFDLQPTSDYHISSEILNSSQVGGTLELQYLSQEDPFQTVSSSQHPLHSSTEGLSVETDFTDLTFSAFEPFANLTNDNSNRSVNLFIPPSDLPEISTSSHLLTSTTPMIHPFVGHTQSGGGAGGGGHHMADVLLSLKNPIVHPEDPATWSGIHISQGIASPVQGSGTTLEPNHPRSACPGESNNYNLERQPPSPCGTPSTTSPEGGSVALNRISTFSQSGTSSFYENAAWTTTCGTTTMAAASNFFQGSPVPATISPNHFSYTLQDQQHSHLEGNPWNLGHGSAHFMPNQVISSHFSPTQAFFSTSSPPPGGDPLNVNSPYHQPQDYPYYSNRDHDESILNEDKEHDDGLYVTKSPSYESRSIFEGAPTRRSLRSSRARNLSASADLINKHIYGSNNSLDGGALLHNSFGTHPNSPDSSTDNTKNICGICGKTYARPSTLKTHMRTHSGERPYRCYSCNKSFSQAANLTAHCRTHSGEKPFHCSICNRKFSQSSSVTTHMRTHSGERPYRCRLCKKAFSDSSTLTKHLRIHSGEKPYECKLCHLRFSQSGNLNRHMRIHAQTGR